MALSAIGYSDSPLTSSSDGRVRVSSQLKHRPPGASDSHVQPDRAELAHTCHTRPDASTYWPCWSTGTIAFSSRENPRWVPHVTQLELPK